MLNMYVQKRTTGSKLCADKDSGILPSAAFTRIKGRIDKRMAALVLVCACCCIAYFFMLAASFASAGRVSAAYPALSLRYASDFSAQTAEQARRYSIEKKETTPFFPTFWKQAQKEAVSDLRSIETKCVYYDGNPALVYPAEMLSGELPGMADTFGCAVSESLAWALWGGKDVTGVKIKIDGTEYTVRGVFKGGEKLAVANGGAGSGYKGGWNNVELSGESKKAPLTAGGDYATASGLGTPQSIVAGTDYRFIVTVLKTLPVITVLCIALCFFMPVIWRKLAGKRQIILFCILLFLALMLPYLLENVPLWLLPAQWSDFSFWKTTGDEIGKNLRNSFALNPYEKDIEARMQLFALIIKSISGCVFAAAAGVAVRKINAESPYKLRGGNIYV